MSSNTSLRRRNPGKPYHCSICNRDFARAEHLQRHTTTHTNEKAHVCFCGKAFARKDLLRRHEHNGKHLTMTPSGSSPSDTYAQQSHNNSVVEHLGSSNATPENVDVSHTSGGNEMNHQQSAFHIHPTPSAQQQIQPESSVSYTQNDGLLFPNDFNDFSNFIDTMGLNAGLDFLYDPTYNFQDVSYTQNGLYGSELSIDSRIIPTMTTAIPTSTAPVTSASTRTIRPMEDDFEELGPVVCPWKIHDDERARIVAALIPFQDILGGFALPSRLMLGRFITAYFETYQDHMPILHPVTFRPAHFHKYPALLLAMCAIGATYRFETRTSMEFFCASKKIVLATWQDVEASEQGIKSSTEDSVRQLRTVQAAMLLDKFAVCQCVSQSAQDSLALQSLLAAYLRKSKGLINSSKDLLCDDWHDWVLQESYCRTQLAIFFVLNLHTIFLDMPPTALSSQLTVDLPCSTAEWNAPSQASWEHVRKSSLKPISFQDAFSALFSKTQADKHLNYSPFANLVLIHALLQRIYLARQMLSNPSGSVRSADIDEIGLALKQWTTIWRQAPESILDPLNHDGSNSLTSTAFLGLARIRLYSDYSRSMQMGVWDAETMAKSLFDTAPPARTENMTLALLHSAHALNFLVKFGIKYISRTMFGRWDNQNLFYYLEAAVFLSKWLGTVAETHMSTQPTEAETKIVGIVIRVVEELGTSLDTQEGLGHIYTLEDLDRGDLTSILRRLSSQIARSWAIVFSNSSAPWTVVDVITQTLRQYAEMMEDSVLKLEEAGVI